MKWDLPTEFITGRTRCPAASSSGWALVNDPVMILADEATGNLDTRTSFEILTLFQKLHREGRTIVFVTHNPEIAEFCSRNIVLRDGRIVEDVQNTQVRSAKEVLDSLPQDSGQ